jgi:hypothetical protein
VLKDVWLSSELPPWARTWCYDLPGNAGLYRDHLDRRVVVDAEGTGSYQLHGQRSAFSGMTVVTVAEHAVLGPISVELGCGESPCYEVVPAGEVLGSGWARGSTSAILADGQSYPPGVNVPFFRSVSAGQAFQVLVVGGPARLVAVVRPFAPEPTVGAQVVIHNRSQGERRTLFSEEGPEEHWLGVHLNEMRIELSGLAGPCGVRIERTYDAFHGRQRARVRLNGCEVGAWYTPFEDRANRLRRDAFGFFVAEGAEVIEIGIDPSPGYPLWSVAELRIYTLEGPSTPIAVG